MNDPQGAEETIPTASAVGRQDQAWETELLQLLSTLESFRARLHDDCHAGRALPAVEAMLAVAKGVAAFVRSRLGDDGAEARAAADAFFAAVRPLHARLDDDVFKALLRLLRRRDPRDPREQFVDAAAKLRTFLNNAFALCAGRFVSSFSRVSWVETYTVFLDDLDDLIEQVRP